MMVTLPMKTQKLLCLAKTAAMAAGQLQVDALKTGFSIETKSSNIDLVTSVDKACDQRIRDVISQMYEEENLGKPRFLTEETYGEEAENFSGTSVSRLAHTWVIDPIDGTTNFAHGFPYFAAVITYFDEVGPLVGVVFDPNQNECFTAIRGEGVYLNDLPVKISKTQTLQQSLLATGFAYDIAQNPSDNMDLFQAFLVRSQGVRRPGAAALDLAYVACGRLDGFWEKRLSIWDMAASYLFIQEAGGQISDLQGCPLTWPVHGIDVVAANSALHPAMIQIIADEMQLAP